VLLLDPDSLVEFGLWAQEGSGEPGGKVLAAERVVTGKGWVDGLAVYASRTGTITEVYAEVGASVQVRDPLILYTPEG
jgi:acetyl-CoA carboxylase carboxyltransferase component